MLLFIKITGCLRDIHAFPTPRTPELRVLQRFVQLGGQTRSFFRKVRSGQQEERFESLKVSNNQSQPSRVSRQPWSPPPPKQNANCCAENSEPRRSRTLPASVLQSFVVLVWQTRSFLHKDRYGQPEKRFEIFKVSHNPFQTSLITRQP